MVIHLYLAIVPTGSEVVKLQNKKRLQKFTLKECQDSVLLLLQNAHELEEQINELRKKSAANKNTVQPFIIAIGENFFEATEFFMYCDGVIYKFSSIVSALDCCLKTFYILNLSYPSASKTFWYIMQHSIFEIKLDDWARTPTLIKFLQSF